MWKRGNLDICGLSATSRSQFNMSDQQKFRQLSDTNLVNCKIQLFKLKNKNFNSAYEYETSCNHPITIHG